MAQALGSWAETTPPNGAATGVVSCEQTSGAEERSLPDLSRLGLLLCFASAVLTLIGVGSALERMFS